jgi:AI-2 transport protein TqsA
MIMPPSPPDPRATDARIRTTCLVVLTIIAVGFALVPLRPVLVPLLIALLFTYCLKPLIDFQVNRLGFPRGVAIAGAVLVALIALGLAATVVINFAADLRHNLHAYSDEFNKTSLKVAADLEHNAGVKIKHPPQLSEKSIQDAMEGTPWSNVMGSIADVISGSGLVLIFVLFLLVGGSAHPPRAGTLMHEIETRAQRYILQMVGFSVLTGLLVGLSLRVIGLKADHAFAFGFVAFLLNFIPTVGPLIATLLPLPIVLLDQSLYPWQKVLAIALPAAVQLAFAVIQPRVQGKGQDLHPVTAMAALVFFGSIWGILGAALAVPVTGVVKIILERIPNTQPVADWMAGRFPHNLPAPPAPAAPGPEGDKAAASAAPSCPESHVG